MKCTKCTNSAHGFDLTNGECGACAANCAACAADKTKCTKGNDGYYIVSDAPVACKSGGNCKTCADANKCATCMAGFVKDPVDGLCKACATGC